MTTREKVFKARELLQEALEEGIDYSQFQSAIASKKFIKKAIKDLEWIA